MCIIIIYNKNKKIRSMIGDRGTLPEVCGPWLHKHKHEKWLKTKQDEKRKRERVKKEILGKHMFGFVFFSNVLCF